MYTAAEEATVRDFNGSKPDEVWVNSIGQSVGVPGWDELMKDSPQLAFTLLAFLELEGEALLGYSQQPTQQEILMKAIDLGANYSVKSQNQIWKNLQVLTDMGHLFDLRPIEGQGKRGSRAPRASNYLRPLFFKRR